MSDTVTRDPHLTEALNANYAALLNDVEQARQLAADYQSQLSDKTNDAALLKTVLEKTSADLAKMQEDILSLRKERHALANQAMKGVAYQAKLNCVTLERDQLKVERDQLKLENDALRQEASRLRDTVSCLEAEKPKVSKAETPAKPGTPPAPKEEIDLSFQEGDDTIEIYPAAQERRWKSPSRGG